MNRVVLLVGIIAALVAGLCGFATAGEVDILIDKLVEKGILNSSEAQEVRNEVNQEIVARETKIIETAKKDAVPKWAQKTSWDGDIRLRDEFRDRTAATDAHRQRVRLRLGIKSKINDQLEVGARLATGSLTDPVSTNQTLDDTFTKKSFNLDRAYVTYTPTLPVQGKLALTGGMIENPYWLVGPMVWDDDLSFAGLAAKYETALGPATVFLNNGIFTVDSDGFGKDNPYLLGTQAGFSVIPLPDVSWDVIGQAKLTAALALYDYHNTHNNGVLLVNTQAGNSHPLKDFNEINPTVELASKIGEIPVALFGDLVHNTGASHDDLGYHFGVKAGKAKKPWSLKEGWEAGYFYQKLEADAAFDAFVDSDFGGGGTNHKGHVGWMRLAVLENSTFGVKFFDTEQATGSKNRFDTVQFDWVTKF